MASLFITQVLTAVKFSVSGTGGAAWKVRVGDTTSLAGTYWEKTGTGDTVFNTGLFGIGKHYGFLIIAGSVAASTDFTEVEVYYPPTTPPPTPPPPPPPPPPPSGGIGYCIIEAYPSSFGTLFRYGRGGGEILGDGYMTSSDAEYHASINNKCFLAPVPVPKPADLPGLVQGAVAASTAATAANITVAKNELQQQGATTQAATTISFNILTRIQNALLPDLKKKADEIWERVASTTQQLIEIRNTLIGKIDAVAAWQTNFKFPDIAALLKIHVVDKLDAWASALVGVDPAKPFWDALAAKIDVRISNKFGVDPALPFFDALYAKIEGKIDVWISGKFGVDPAKPFWDELEKKIIALAVKIMSAGLDALLPDPEFWKKKS